jgi:hypothetical protein
MATPMGVGIEGMDGSATAIVGVRCSEKGNLGTQCVGSKPTQLRRHQISLGRVDASRPTTDSSTALW